MFYVYVLKSSTDGKLYTGFTNNLKARFDKHQSGKVASTRHRGSFEVIYLEGCLNKFDAIRREKYLKSGRGKMFLRKRLKFWYQEKSNKE